MSKTNEPAVGGMSSAGALKIWMRAVEHVKGVRELATAGGTREQSGFEEAMEMLPQLGLCLEAALRGRGEGILKHMLTDLAALRKDLAALRNNGEGDSL